MSKLRALENAMISGPRETHRCTMKWNKRYWHGKSSTGMPHNTRWGIQGKLQCFRKAVYHEKIYVTDGDHFYVLHRNNITET